jgi:hypothetical protein
MHNENDREVERGRARTTRGIVGQTQSEKGFEDLRYLKCEEKQVTETNNNKREVQEKKDTTKRTSWRIHNYFRSFNVSAENKR